MDNGSSRASVQRKISTWKSTKAKQRRASTPSYDYSDVPF